MNEINNSLMNTGTLWLPEAISDIAGSVDSLFYFIFWISVLTFIGIMGVSLYFLVKYRASNNKPKEKHITHNTLIEVVWTVVPTILCMVIFYWGFTDYMRLKTAPGDAIQIRVTGEKWLWNFDYANGTNTVGELAVPVDTPVQLIMSAKDVLHSFFIPNLRVKRDLIPNRYTTIWFEANKTGSFQIFCTEYCGDGHSNMLANLHVMPMDKYQDWLASGGGSNKDMPLAELGAKLYKQMGCNACHTLDGSKSVGPSWLGVYNSHRQLTSGKTVTANDNYIRQAIVDPGSDVVAGYPPVMPTYAGKLSDRDINAIIEFIKAQK
ncbi:cytochrome c oxidase subunit II [bacterium]|jgi:cytochrome c oxidase subunit II|nr:cytochrome c oxidase subunit II [bacterium]